ncbi:porin PorA family protein [uncultured Corynebacterium sp.]|uniref:porin PorA family protein n=1 Tax=uncultured Corynebacterium sp. TaxID=159447 RepID=UPI0025D61174|nr:porin PorA family protein [uncultured Corynebacterium sp.]
MTRFSPLARARWRDPLTWLVVLAIVALLIGAVLPGLIIGRALPLPLGRTFTAVATDPQALVAHGGAAARTELTVKRTTKTTATDVDSVAGVHTVTTLTTGNSVLAAVDDAIDLNRESTYPQSGGADIQTLTVNGTSTTLASEDTDREGLKYFFPSATEKRSYAFFDEVLQDSLPVDYAEKKKIDDIDAYVFRHFIPATPLPSQIADALPAHQVSGTAGDLYDAEELKAFGLAADTYVVLDPFYSVDRELTVDPATGTVLDLHETVRLFYATDAVQADATVAAGADAPGLAHRALLMTDLRWDEATRAAAYDLAAPTVRLHKAMGAVSWAGKALAIVLITCATVTYLRRRSHDEETAAL